MNSTEVFEDPQPDEEELRLSKLVFGDISDFYDGIQNINLYSTSDEEGNNQQSDEASEQEEIVNVEKLQDDKLFFVDDGVDDYKDDIESRDEVEESLHENDSSNDSAAWSDSEDERIEVSITKSNRLKKLRSSYSEKEINSKQYVRRLRLQFEKIYPKPKWVDNLQNNSCESGDDIDEGKSDIVVDCDINALKKILQSTYSYKADKNDLLAPVILDITRLADATVTTPLKSAVQSLSFHPFRPLLLAGGYDRTLRIYHIDGKVNDLVFSLYLTGTPVQTCKFYVNPSTNEQIILSGGRRRYMHKWDILSTTRGLTSVEKFSRMYGHEATQRSFEKFKLAHLHSAQGIVHGIILLQANNGWINILHATTGVWLMGCKIEGVLADFCIDYEPSHKRTFNTILIATNKYGEIWEFNLTDHGTVLRRWKDDGGVGITTIQVGGGTNCSNIKSFKNIRKNRWLAIGSESGFVNVYDRHSRSETPIGSLSNLTTTISSLEFSPDGQILCMASRATNDALRLVHLPTITVFSNWPTSGTPLGSVTSVTFSSQGEILAVGNQQGKIRLWRLNHY